MRTILTLLALTLCFGVSAEEPQTVVVPSECEFTMDCPDPPCDCERQCLCTDPGCYTKGQWVDSREGKGEKVRWEFGCKQEIVYEHPVYERDCPEPEVFVEERVVYTEGPVEKIYVHEPEPLRRKYAIGPLARVDEEGIGVQFQTWRKSWIFLAQVTHTDREFSHTIGHEHKVKKCNEYGSCRWKQEHWEKEWSDDGDDTGLWVGALFVWE